MLERNKTCCFTGHRENKLPWGSNEDDPRCIDLKQKLYDTVSSLFSCGVRHFICGMAKGSDMYFCEAVQKLREEHPDVSIEAAIPFEGQSSGWTNDYRCRYDKLVSECDYQTVIQSSYSPDCYLRRNKYMVDHSSYIIVVYDGMPGGTQKTLLYAIRNKLEIIQLPV